MTDANTTLQSPQVDELLLAREIEICVGPYHSSDSRREAMANILLIASKSRPEQLARVITAATALTGLGSL